MRCPKCGGPTFIIEIIDDFSSNKSYKKRICHDCCHNFYTAESEVDRMDKTFKKIWQEYHGRKPFYKKFLS